MASTALALMSDNNVVPTPEHFELFYTYASGQNATLTRIMGEMIAQQLPFPPPILDDLRLRCLVHARVAKAVEGAGSGISEMLDAVLGKLDDAGKHAAITAAPCRKRAANLATTNLRTACASWSMACSAPCG